MPPPTKEQLANREAAMSIPPEDLASFSVANPGMSFDTEELAHYNSSLSSSSLAPTGSPIIPPTQSPRDYSPFATASFESLLADFNKPVAEEAVGGDLQKRILDSLGTIGTEKTRQQTLEGEAGLPGQRQELQGVLNQLQGLQKEALAIPLQIQQEFAGRGVTKGGVAPIETGRLRENTIKSLGLAAIGQTLQGNITLANQTIQNALDAEFEPERQKLATLEKLYTFNRDALERIDKKKADKLQLTLSERSRVLSEQRADREYSSQLMLSAAKSGATPDVLEKMRNSTPEEAIALGSKYFGEEFKQKAEQQAFENKIRTRELALKEADFALNRRTSLLQLAGTGDAQAIKELGYDPRDIPLSYEKLASYESQKINIEKDISDIQAALNNKVGLQASSGLARGAFSSSLLGESGTPFGVLSAPLVAQKRNSFIATARYVVNNLRLEKVGELAEAGIKLNPISEKEIKLMGEASKRLASIGDYDDNGTLKGFIVSDTEVDREMRTVLDHYQKALDEINVSMTMTEADRREIANIK